MQQASECTSTRSIKKRFLFKLAFLSIPRLGFLSLVLLTFGIYMIFPCVSTFLQVHRETSVPHDLSVTADPRDMERLSEIEGVTNITPVGRIPAKLQTDTASQSIEVLGVFSSFLPKDFLEGGPFQDDTHTPFLVINEAAAKSFRTEQGSAAPITLDTKLTLNDQEALMAGILRDDSEQPLCYMSYDTAIRGQAQGEQQEFVLTLKHKGDIANVLKSAHQTGSPMESQQNQSWNTMYQQSCHYGILSILGIMAAGILIRDKQILYSSIDEQERAVLCGLGITSKEVRTVNSIRICSVILIIMGFVFVAILIVKAV